MNNKQLIYNPIISYEKEFYSEKESIFEEILKVDENGQNQDKIEDLENIIEEIQISQAGLSDDLEDLIAGVLDPIIDFIEDNKDFLEGAGEDKEDLDDIDSEDEGNEDDTEIDNEVIFIPIVNIIDKDINTTSQIKQSYRDNIIDLLSDFLLKLKSVLDNYWVNMGLLLIGKSKDYKKFILSDIDQNFVVEKEKQHMLDFAMRSQIHRMSKASYAAKICPVDETLVHLRSIKFATDLMLRYMDTEIKDTTTEYGDLSQTILNSCIVNYRNKYNYTYKSAYKYLNSSVELIDEILQLSIQEAKSKKYLK